MIYAVKHSDIPVTMLFNAQFDAGYAPIGQIWCIAVRNREESLLGGYLQRGKGQCSIEFSLLKWN